MDKPPFPILCKCCNLPAGYTFESVKIPTDVYCFSCTNAMMQIIEDLKTENKYNWDNTFKYIDKIWETENKTQTGIAVFIQSNYAFNILKINT